MLYEIMVDSVSENMVNILGIDRIYLLYYFALKLMVNPIYVRFLKGTKITVILRHNCIRMYPNEG